jgi:aconitate hydratase
VISSGIDTLRTRRTLSVNNIDYDYFSISAAEAAGSGDLRLLPYSLRILLENLLRFEDGRNVTVDDIAAFATWLKERTSEREIAFMPARILMQDFTGVPAIVDLAALRQAAVAAGGDAQRVNPRIPVDLVIDHSVTVERAASDDAFAYNVRVEMERNRERYILLRWAQQSFTNVRVVPPGTGICHQVNLEYLAKVVWSSESDGRRLAYPDTVVGTDSHTPMVNGLGVLAWGVGGIEAEAALLGRPMSMLLPEVIGVRLSGALQPGVTATDLVLTITERLRHFGVVGKFVEFFGAGLEHLPIADRATISNMAPEYGATCGYFPIDQVTLDYLCFTGRDAGTIALVAAYARAQGLWRDLQSVTPLFTATLEFDLASVAPTLAGPKRPQDRVALADLTATFDATLPLAERGKELAVAGQEQPLRQGDVVIAAITSCTNTSNPAVMLTAGLLARKARALGLQSQPWVKTSLAPGSKVVSAYLQQTGLQEDLDALGFQTVGYGCTTCIGNSGPLPAAIATAVQEGMMTVSAVLSGNRNFEGRIHPQVRANWLASPPLVVAFALAGTIRIDLSRDPLGVTPAGVSVYLRDLWPTSSEVAAELAKITPQMFADAYAGVFSGDPEWQGLPVTSSPLFPWDGDSTYIRLPPFVALTEPATGIAGFSGARVLALLGDSITTDHISPAGNIRPDSPAGVYLQKHWVKPADFNSYGSRRGNHQVMVRGTFANVRLHNELIPEREGGFTRYQPSQEMMTIFAAAERYALEKVPLLVIAGQEYGAGSSRDWAAKGPKLLGVRAILAESFERIHRSNLVGMGIFPLQFLDGASRKSLGLDGSEEIDLLPASKIEAKQRLLLRIHRSNGQTFELPVLSRIDTADEVVSFAQQGLLNDVLRRLLVED